MKLKVMTYNIAGGRDYTPYPVKPIYSPTACAQVIKDYSPDVCGLNEVDFGLPRSNKDDLAGVIASYCTGYEHFFAKAVHWEPGDYGNAIISKYPIVSKTVYPIENPKDTREKNYYEPRCILKATIAFPEKNVNVYVTHFGLPRSEKTAAMATLFSILKDETNPCILMGDFNLVETDGFMQAIKTILVDTYDFYPVKDMVTYPSKADIPCDKEGGYKIDYIFVSNDFKVTKVNAIESCASDHKPYYVELEY